MTIMNGASNSSVEDILASIRTSIAEESGPARFVAAEIQMPAQIQARREPQFAEEAPEFELPAIFKPGHHAAPEKPKLLGRLSEALKSTSSTEQSRVRTVIPFDPSAAGRVVDPAPIQFQHAPQATPALMSAAANGPFNGPSRHPDTRHQPGGEEEVKRIMPTFFDTRVNKLGELTREAFKPKPIEPQPAPHVQPQRQPPTLPENFNAHATDAVDDAAAQLLRPMLRQWLQDNMPKIVEKALLSEVQADMPGKPRR